MKVLLPKLLHLLIFSSFSVVGMYNMAVSSVKKPSVEPSNTTETQPDTSTTAFRNITEHFTILDFEEMKRFVLEYGDRETYSSRYGNNPHYSFKDLKPVSSLGFLLQTKAFWDNQKTQEFT